MQVLEWLFDGLGTMVLGLLIGGVAGAAGGWKLAVRRNSRNQSQKARDNVTQMQAGRDVRPGKQ